MPDPVLAIFLLLACCISQWFRGSLQERDRSFGGSKNLALARKLVKEEEMLSKKNILPGTNILN